MMSFSELPAPSLAEHYFSSIPALTDEALFEACGIRVAFTERFGGISTGPYESLNLGSHVNDDIKLVQKNRSLLMQALASSRWPLVVPKQVHGKKVLTITSDEDVLPVSEQAAQGADALVVATKQVAALLCFADCVPVIAVSPTGSFSVIHAGWRGVENGIVPRALEKLASESQALTGISTAHVLRGVNVYIGPYIHAECFETGPEVHKRFVDTYGSECALDDAHINLGSVLRTQLVQAGVSGERICDSDICTVCNNDKFFSFRAQNGIAGRHGAFAVRI